MIKMMMKKVKILHTLCFGLLLLQFAVFETAHCRLLEEEKHVLGGVHDHYYHNGLQNDAAEIESIGRFAVEEHNKKENLLLEFARVIKAKEQVVAGKMYHLTLEAIDAGKEKIYEAKVWVKPWMNFKQLQEFKHADGVPSFTSSNLNAS